MRRLTLHSKILVFVPLPVCVWRNSGCINYSIRLKFGTNVYALYEFSCIVFGVQCPNCVYRNIQKYLSTLRPMEGNSLKSVLRWLLRIKFNEIYVRNSDAQSNNLSGKCMYVAETERVQGHTISKF